MPTKKTDPREWLDLLIEKAEMLRRAGVYHVELDGCKVALVPYSEPQDIQAQAAEALDPLMDPATFTHTPGRRMPSLRRLGGNGQ